MLRYPVIKREHILPSGGSYKSDYPFIKVHLWQSDLMIQMTHATLGLKAFAMNHGVTLT